MEAEKVEESDSETPQVPVDRLVKVYRKMQTQLQVLQAEHDAKVEAIKSQQDVVKNALKDLMLTQNCTSLRTPEGTVVLSTKTKYSTQDWDAFKSFVIDNECVDLLEKRIAQANMAQWLESNPDKVPAGLNQYSEYQISVRKVTK